MKTVDEIRSALAVALDENQRAAKYEPTDNPLDGLQVRDLVQGRGIRTSADQYPAVDMNARLNGESTTAQRLDLVRRAGMLDGRRDRSARRMSAARARAARKAQIDAIEKLPTKPSKERMEAAWAVVAPLAPIVEKIARSKRSWAMRFLGSITDDIGQVAIEKMALVLAKDDSRDLGVLQEAAIELGHFTSRTGRLPADQVSDDERKHRKQVAKGRKWLMGMANNRVMGALVDAYTSQKNLRWENIDLISTVMASISGVSDDPMIQNTKADRAPAMLGSQMPRPGELDRAILAEIISAAITARGLDRMAELLLDEDRRRTDGAFKWTENAEAVFYATPDPWGDPSQAARLKWTLVRSATAKLSDPERAQGRAAREHACQQFGFLPGVIVNAVRAFDYEATDRIYYQCRTEPRAYTIQTRIESEWDRLIGRTPSGPRLVARPALAYASVEEAARVLAEHISVLVTGQDYTESIAYA